MKVTKVIMTKLSSNQNSLRSNEVIGEPVSYPPTKGQSFVVIGDPLEIKEGHRIVQTSVVEKVERNVVGYIINTLNSRYLIEELEVVPEEGDVAQ